MGEISIQRVVAADTSCLQQISQKTFYETFAPHNSEKNMRQYLEEGFSMDKLSSEMGHPGSEFFFAKLGEEVIGYLKINTGVAQTEIRDSTGLEIERIYVAQEYQGRKVGQLLYEWALQIARDGLFEYLWLGVWEHNTKAIRFYQKNGFEPFDKHVFRLGDDEQTDIMMKKKLL